MHGRIVGWKVARLVIADDGSTRFAGLAANSVTATFYDAEAAAHCSLGKAHRVPSWDCSCGFHIARSIDELSSMYHDWDQPTFALLQVEAWGDVVEHEHGIRAQRQRVLGISVADWCTFCGEPATELGAHYAAPETSMRYGPTDLIHLVPSCTDCNRRKCLGKTFALAEIAGQLGVEVSRRGRTATSVAVRNRKRSTSSRRLLLGVVSSVAGVLGISEVASGAAATGALYLSSACAGAVAASLAVTRMPRVQSALTWVALLGFGTGVLSSIDSASTASVPASAPWFEAAAESVQDLPSDPYLAFEQLAALQVPYDVIPVGDGQGVAGVAVVSSYAVSPLCAVIARGGDVLYDGDDGADACLLRGRELLLSP